GAGHRRHPAARRIRRGGRRDHRSDRALPHPGPGVLRRGAHQRPGVRLRLRHHRRDRAGRAAHRPRRAAARVPGSEPLSTPTVPAPAAQQAPERPSAARRLLRDPVAISAAVTLLLWTATVLYSPSFAGWGQVVTLLTVASFLGVIAIGQTLVIIAGGEGIDLSVGATATLSAIIASRFMAGSDEGFLTAVLLALAACCVVGAVNAVGVLVFRVPPLVMTLGMIAVVTGFIRLYTGGRPEGSAAPLLRTLVTGDTVAGIPGVLWLWLGLTVLVIWLLRRSPFGWRLYAVGGNPSTAYLSGANTAAVQ